MATARKPCDRNFREIATSPLLSTTRNRITTFARYNPLAMKGGDPEGALVVDIHVVPRSSRAAVGPAMGDRLRVAVTAPPVDGAANAAVIEALARAFGVRRAGVRNRGGVTWEKKRPWAGRGGPRAIS